MKKSKHPKSGKESKNLDISNTEPQPGPSNVNAKSEESADKNHKEPNLYYDKTNSRQKFKNFKNNNSDDDDEDYDEPPRTPRCKPAPSSDDDSDQDRLNIDEGQGTILVTIDNTKPEKELKNNTK